MLGVIILLPQGLMAEVSGGYINTAEGKMFVALNANSNNIIVGASLSPVEINAPLAKFRGDLFVVYPNGRVLTLKKNFADRRGNVIAVPRDKFDKVVFLNNNAIVMGGIGLSETEAAKMAAFYGATGSEETVAELSLENVENLMKAIDLAGLSAHEAYRARDDERKELFAAVVGMNAGHRFQKMVTDIMLAADVDENAPFKNLPFESEKIENEDMFQKVASGISIIADDDDNGGGGKGIVADDDDNGGGGKGIVADDDDNGGGGKGAVATIVEGWDSKLNDLDVPSIDKINANCSGLFIFVD